MNYKFEVIGKPTSKGRPRLGRYGTYTDEKTVNYENLVKYSFLNKYKPELIEGAIKVKMLAIFEVPQSYSKKKRVTLLNTKCNYTHKPDVDNISKIILDSLNGLAYKDDSQITRLEIEKQYGEQAKVIVEIEEV